MSLSASTPASVIRPVYLTNVTTPPYTASIASAWASGFLQWSTAGVLSGGGGVAGSEDESIVESFIGSLTGNTTVNAFATMLASYWSTCLLVPNGTAVSVSNNAMSQVAAFEAAVNASITTSDTTPYFQHLFTNIQNIALPSVIWTVNRVVAGSPVVTMETVS
jgi:hypothetical protein